MIIRIITVMSLCLSLTGCGASLGLSIGSLGLGIFQKSTASTVYSAVDVGVNAQTGKSIREHVLEPDAEVVAPLTVNDVITEGSIEWVTPK